MNMTGLNEGTDNLNYNMSMNGTSNSTGVLSETPMYILVISTVFFLLIFIVGLVGNIYIIALVCGVKHMRTKMSLLFVNLSITDLLVLMICMPSGAVDVYADEVWYFGEAACVLVIFLESAVTLASCLTILVIAVDRYLAICKSTTDNVWKRLSVTTKMIGIWTLAISTSVPFAFAVKFKDEKYEDGTTVKKCYPSLDSTWKIGYYLSVSVVFFCMVFLILVILIQRMASVLLQASNLFEGQIQTKRIRERRRVAVMLFLIAVCFFVCLLPVRLLVIWFIYDGGKQISGLGEEAYKNLTISVRMVMYLNSALSPVIYNSMSTNVRKVTASLLSKWCILCKKQRKYEIGNQNIAITRRKSDIPGRQREFNLGQISIITLNQL
ncbi:hypothetical protein FSP39_009649 [Pinctada imbricata]|uniref:G-protein coupled receptors family 1 profile domain-containing protein n=1 Tax=Pinctada imbricata TaxID=66713 RepID=A0AA88XQZ4_PINIB|nr:hypothetical protein FSP39_009649 [Pinctada imbricata]